MTVFGDEGEVFDRLDVIDEKQDVGEEDRLKADGHEFTGFFEFVEAETLEG